MNREAERKRLVELCEDVVLSCKSSLCADCEHNKIDYPHCMSEHFADHLLDNGIVVPPVKVGDKLYFVYENNIYDMTVEKIVMKEAGLFLVDKGFNDWYSVKEIGKTLYLTREEAEAKLKGEGK